MAMNSFLNNENFAVDKLTHEIFHLLENKFLFGSSGDPESFLTGKSDILDKSNLQDFKKIDAGKVRILSIDGGGSTDGILAAKSLVLLEASLCRASGKPDARISDFFDVATGSGVGGILAALLFTRGKEGRSIFTANEALNFIVKNRRKLISSPKKKNGIFKRILRSSSSKGENALFCPLFGESTLRDTLKPVLIPCFDLSTRAPFLFSRADAFEEDGYDFKMSEICAATSADPIAKGAFEMSSVDKKTKIVAINGGLAMNNPTSAAITHVLNNKKEFPFCESVEDLLMVSLGNGVSDSSSGAPNFVKIGGEAASDMIDEAVSMAFGNVRASSNYVRIQGNGEVADEMLRQKSVESVMFRGKKVAEKTNSDKLEWFAGELVKEQERRKMSIYPTVMYKQSSPRSSSATTSTVSSY